jgi:hypothetical protein
VESVDSIEGRRRYFEGISDEDLIMGVAAAMESMDFAQAADIMAELAHRKGA